MWVWINAALLLSDAEYKYSLEIIINIENPNHNWETDLGDLVEKYIFILFLKNDPATLKSIGDSTKQNLYNKLNLLISDPQT